LAPKGREIANEIYDSLDRLCPKNWKSTKKHFCYYPLKPSKFLIIMQNAKNLSTSRNKEEIKDYNQIKPGDIDSYIDTSKKWLKTWMIRKGNCKFFNKFFKLLSNYHLIDYPGTLENFLKDDTPGNFFELFSVTDASKCRSSTSDLMPTCFTNYEEYVEREIELVKPDLIFSFGSWTWEWGIFPRYKSRLKIISEDGGQNQKKVTKVHGYLFKHDGYPCFYIIPLAHLSQRMVNFYLRDSYFFYLKKGLETYSKFTRAH